MAAQIKIDIFKGEAITDFQLSNSSELEVLQLLNALAVAQVKVSEKLAAQCGVKIREKSTNG